MTANATRFVTPLSFEALSGNRVVWRMFGEDAGAMDHITWGQEADLIILAPATANFIAKLAHGMADDFLSTMVLAATAPVLICPSMNARMYENPATTENLSSLKTRGVRVMAPGEGQLACRTEGPGRLPEPPDILEEAKRCLSRQDLAGLRVLVTAGATQEPMDPVRFITNRSTGKMGYAVAAAACRRGASVTLVTGPTSISPPRGAVVEKVRTALEMREAVMEKALGCNVVIMTAAVSDYRPHCSAEQKIKKGADSISVELDRNPDILEELGRSMNGKGCILVGFAAETHKLMAHAQEKLKKKNLDMIVANDVSRKDAGFGCDTNEVKMIFRDGRVEDSPLMSKEGIADIVLDRINALRKTA
jgi:phosphopantothenoylcysteine decarboxylase/phosphopantothenate--cysteine ligase